MPTDPAVAALQREVEELKLALIADRGRIDLASRRSPRGSRRLELSHDFQNYYYVCRP